MARRLYQFTVLRHDDGMPRQVGSPIAHHLDLDEAEVAYALLKCLIADAARRDGSRARDVWKYTMRVRDLRDGRDVFEYVVTTGQVEDLPW